MVRNTLNEMLEKVYSVIPGTDSMEIGHLDRTEAIRLRNGFERGKYANDYSCEVKAVFGPWIPEVGDPVEPQYKFIVRKK